MKLTKDDAIEMLQAGEATREGNLVILDCGVFGKQAVQVTDSDIEVYEKALDAEIAEMEAQVAETENARVRLEKLKSKKRGNS